MINDVYNLVQTILNKNRFGEITPTRFNLFGKNAQIKIFDEALSDLRRAKYKSHTGRGKEDLKATREVLDNFIVEYDLTRKPASVVNSYFTIPSNFAYEESLWLNNTVNISRMPKAKNGYIRGNKLVQPSEASPFYDKYADRIIIYPSTVGVLGGEAIDEVTMYYYKTPADPKWTYTDVSNIAVFNPSASDYQDFELPEFLFNRIVTDICLQAGVQLREEQVVQFAQAEDGKSFNKENIS